MLLLNLLLGDLDVEGLFDVGEFALHVLLLLLFVQLVALLLFHLVLDDAALELALCGVALLHGVGHAVHEELDLVLARLPLLSPLLVLQLYHPVVLLDRPVLRESLSLLVLQHLGFGDLVLLDHAASRFALVNPLVEARLLLLGELLLQPGHQLNLLGPLLLRLVLLAALGVAQLLVVEFLLVVDLALELSLLLKLLLLLFSHALKQLPVVVPLLFLLSILLPFLLLELTVKYVPKLLLFGGELLSLLLLVLFVLLLPIFNDLNPLVVGEVAWHG